MRLLCGCVYDPEARVVIRQCARHIAKPVRDGDDRGDRDGLLGLFCLALIVGLVFCFGMYWLGVLFGKLFAG